MFKTQWILLASWTVEKDKHRVIFKPRDTGINLIDITIKKRNVNEIIYKIMNSCMDTNELIDYLNKNGYSESAFLKTSQKTT